MSRVKARNHEFTPAVRRISRGAVIRGSELGAYGTLVIGGAGEGSAAVW